MMNLNNPPTLQQLARRSLLKDEALTISALQDLPMQLFPPLFKDAFTSKQLNILRHMVAAWPFPCLPLGALIETHHVKSLKAVLDGLELLTTQKDRPRRCKLQVLDLRDVHHDFWNGWAGLQHAVCTPDVISMSQPVGSHPILEEKHALTILLNLSIVSDSPSKYLKYFYCWAMQRKDVIQVICPKLVFHAIPTCHPLYFLELFDPGLIKILEIKTCWDIYSLALLAPGLGQMINIKKLLFKSICKPLDGAWSQEIEAWCVSDIIPQFSKLHQLQHLYLNDVCFLNGCLDQVVGCLKSPLKTLAITHCSLSQSDMQYLSQCPSVHQLKHLDLSGVTFMNFSHPFLGSLLERLTATLQTLKLKGCMIMDFQINALLPGLSQCSQLTEVNFVRNFLSMDSLQRLLQHTANLTQLTLEKYPAPDEAYDSIGAIIPRRFVQLCSELMDTLKEIRQPKEVYFVSQRCLDCQEFFIYNLEAIPCSCWEEI